MQKIGKILNFKHGKSSLMKSVRASLIVESFNKCVVAEWGQSMATHVNGISYKNKTLTIACLSAVAANEVKLKQEKLIKEINNEFGEKIVVDIKYVL
jgi:hypothetical protein